MRGGDKNGLSTDPVHVDAGARLKVIQVDVAIFGDEKDDIMLGAYLEEDKTGKERQEWVSNTENNCYWKYIYLNKGCDEIKIWLDFSLRWKAFLWYRDSVRVTLG